MQRHPSNSCRPVARGSASASRCLYHPRLVRSRQDQRKKRSQTTRAQRVAWSAAALRDKLTIWALTFALLIIGAYDATAFVLGDLHWTADVWAWSMESRLSVLSGLGLCAVAATGIE